MPKICHAVLKKPSTISKPRETQPENRKKPDTQSTEGKTGRLRTSDLTAEVCNTMLDTLTRQNNVTICTKYCLYSVPTR